MANKKRKSIVVGTYPEMWIPEFLRSPVRIRIFWYWRLWNLLKVIGRVLVRPFKSNKPKLEVVAKGGAK